MIAPVPITQITPISEKVMEKIVAEISARDKKMAKVIADNPLCTIGRNPKPVPHFESLVESIISQQLAVKAAETIFLRVKKVAGGRVIPARIASLSEVQMREAGVSGAKIRAIQGLASAAINREISFNTLHEIDCDEEITPKALQLKGEKFQPYRSVVAWYCWRALN